MAVVAVAGTAVLTLVFGGLATASASADVPSPADCANAKVELHTVLENDHQADAALRKAEKADKEARAKLAHATTVYNDAVTAATEAQTAYNTAVTKAGFAYDSTHGGPKQPPAVPADRAAAIKADPTVVSTLETLNTDNGTVVKDLGLGQDANSAVNDPIKGTAAKLAAAQGNDQTTHKALAAIYLTLNACKVPVPTPTPTPTPTTPVTVVNTVPAMPTDGNPSSVTIINNQAPAPVIQDSGPAVTH